MRRPADELRKYINFKFSDTLSTKVADEYIDQATKMFNYPSNAFVDFISFKRSLEEANDYDLFVMLSVIDKGKLEEFYTEKEIEYYGDYKYKKLELDKNLKFNVVEIVEDQQWIGKVTAKELIKFKEAQLINYNENTQRTMKHMVMGGNEYYQIFLNSTAVNSIVKLLKSGLYISSTITLNIPEDVDYSYNKKQNQLSLTNVNYLDIIDGYHRYIAISKCVYDDENFDYPMELRLVRYNESKANQFIYQEDQKTRMTKIDSESKNQYSEANQIVRKLNENCENLAGQITINNSIIDASVLSRYIDLLYFDGVKAVYKRKEIKSELTKALKKNLDDITDYDISLIKEKWSRSFLLGFMLGCEKYDDIGTIKKRAEKFAREYTVDIYRLTKKQIKEYEEAI